MCKMMEDMRKQVAKDARYTERVDMAIRMLREGDLSPKYFGFILAEVKALISWPA